MDKNFQLKIDKSENESIKNKYNLEFQLKKEGLENFPKIETKFFFHHHASKKDGEAVGEYLKNSDVLIQENAGWDLARLDIFNDVSKGILTPDQAMDMEKQNGKPLLWKDFYKSLFEGIYKSNKDIVIVDVPDESIIFKNLINLYTGEKAAYNNLINKSLSYEETLRRVINVSKFESDMQKAREDYILENISHNIANLLKNNPEMMKKEKLKLLFSMGGFHTRLFHEMKKAGNNVTQNFSAMPYHFDPRMAIERNLHLNGIEKAEPLIPKIILCLILRKEIPNIDISNNLIFSFSNEEIKNIYKKYQVCTKEEFVNYFESIL